MWVASDIVPFVIAASHLTQLSTKVDNETNNLERGSMDTISSTIPR